MKSSSGNRAPATSSGTYVLHLEVRATDLINDYLMSESKLQKMGFGLHRPPNSRTCIITDSDGNTVYTAPLNNGFYEIHFCFTHSVKKVFHEQLWRVRFGHAGCKVVDEALKQHNLRANHWN